MHKKPIFPVRDLSSYMRMHTRQLFGIYLNMSVQDKLYGSDREELKKVEDSLRGRSLYEKVYFYWGLSDLQHQEIYGEKFFVI